LDTAAEARPQSLLLRSVRASTAGSPDQARAEPDAFEELRGLIGLAAVKKQVEDITNLEKVNQARRSQG